MNRALSETILYVTGKPGIENSSQQELQNIIAEHPYFTPAQLVYAVKLKSENSFKLQTQIQKTGLFFNNFRWLQYQLMEVNIGGFTSGAKDEIIAANDYEQTVSVNNVDENIGIANKRGIAVNEEIVAKNSVVNEVEQPIEMVENIVEEKQPIENSFLSNLSIPTIEEVKNLMNGIDEKRESIAVENFEEIVEPNSYNEVIETEQIIDTNKTEFIAETINELNVVEHLEETILHQSYNGIKEISENQLSVAEQYETVETVAAPENDIHAQIAALKANWYITHPQHSVEIEEEINEPETIANVEVAAPLVEEKQFEINTAIPSLRADWDKPLENFANSPLPFETEPYYTIDYFASQGIKFDYNKEPQDKLTTKMLKFTDWLKKMKNAKPENVVVEVDPELDKVISNIATASNQSKEIVTETMAEVFAKQGKIEKAIQLYIKLSFLIPDKTTYFAAKIKELKGI